MGVLKLSSAILASRASVSAAPLLIPHVSGERACLRVHVQTEKKCFSFLGPVLCRCLYSSISALKCVPYKISSCEGTTDVVLRPTWCRCHGAGAPPEGGSVPRVSIFGILAARCLVSPLRRAADACLAFAAAPRIAQLMWCCCVQSSWSGCMVRARSQVTCASLACECCAPSAANLSDEDAFTGAG